MTHNITTISPSTAAPVPSFSEDDGYCDKWSPWAMIPFGVSFALFLFVILIDILAKLGPSKGRLSYGRPWAIIHLLLSLGVWNLLPPTLAFVFYFHIWTADQWPSLEVVSRVTCLENYGSIPFISIFLVFQGLSILCAYRPPTFVKAVSELLFPTDALQRIVDKLTPRQRAAYHRPTVLMVGGTSRGVVYLEILQRALSQYKSLLHRGGVQPVARPRVVLVDVTATRNWVVNNADAMGLVGTGDVDVVSLGPRHPPSTTAEMLAEQQKKNAANDSERPRSALEVSLIQRPQSRDAADVDSSVAVNVTARTLLPPDSFVPFALAELRDNEVDEVLLAPYLRRMPPVGDFVAPPAELKLRVVAMLAEVKRVLRPGGVVRVVEPLLDALAFEDDLVEAGFKITKATHYTGEKIGAIFYMKTEQFSCEAMKPEDPQSGWEDDTRLDQAISSVMRALPSSYSTTSRTGFLLDDDDQPLNRDGAADDVSNGGRKLAHASSFTGYVALIVTQFTFFIILMAIASALAEPLWVPKDVVAAKRVSNLAMNVALGYPMFAYMSRLAAMSAAPSKSLSALIVSTLVRESLATVASLVLSALIFVPELLLQLALANTSLSSSIKSIIAKCISVAIGVFGYKRGSAQRLNSSLSASHCTMERYQSLLDSAKGNGCFGMC